MWVPLERALEQHGDVAQMTDRAGAMADLGGADRVLAVADTIEEIAFVIPALIQMRLVRPDQRG